MLLRCIFVSIAGLLCACAGAPSPDRVQIQGTPPDNTLTPRLPRSDQGLSPDWFLGDWRVGASGCMLHLGRSDAEGASPAAGLFFFGGDGPAGLPGSASNF